MKPRDYQLDVIEKTYAAWDKGAVNNLMVMPTGAGKTFTFTWLIKELGMRTVISAHRQELVFQISMALSTLGIVHRIEGTKALIKLCVSVQTQKFGRGFVRPEAPVLLGGTRTILSRAKSLRFELSRAQLWVQDEAHHILQSNEFGRVVELMPESCKGLGVTATPLRADGKGLGAHQDGVFHAMVMGPSTRQLIDMGNLSDYMIIGDPNGADMSKVKVGSSGDYVQKQMQTAMQQQRQKVIGNVPQHYLKYAAGKLGITFAPSIEMAGELVQAYQMYGIPAALVTGKTPDAERQDALKRFQNKELMQLVNVDLFGEGFDVPGIEVVTMCRPTASWGLFMQQFGRGLRTAVGKNKAIILDHVGNVFRHGLPDTPKEFTLDRASKSAGAVKSDAIPTKLCDNCMAVYEKIEIACPYCKHIPEPTSRTSPEAVDGDLTLLTPEVLARLRGEMSKIDMATEIYRKKLRDMGCSHIIVATNVKRHTANQQMQSTLRRNIEAYLGLELHEGSELNRAYKKFYAQMGVDVLSAKALKEKDCHELNKKLEKLLDKRLNTL